MSFLPWKQRQVVDSQAAGNESSLLCVLFRAWLWRWRGMAVTTGQDVSHLNCYHFWQIWGKEKQICSLRGRLFPNGMRNGRSKKQTKQTNDSGHSLFLITPSVFLTAKHRAALKKRQQYSLTNGGVWPPEVLLRNSKLLTHSPAQSLSTPPVIPNRFFRSGLRQKHFGFGAVVSYVSNYLLVLKVKIWLFADDLKFF